ncbi:MAG TPA: hypothetical protein VGI96_51415, partial [Streptosporangiaceae bacterium]
QLLAQASQRRLAAAAPDSAAGITRRLAAVIARGAVAIAGAPGRYLTGRPGSARPISARPARSRPWPRRAAARRPEPAGRRLRFAWYDGDRGIADDFLLTVFYERRRVRHRAGGQRREVATS